MRALCLLVILFAEPCFSAEGQLPALYNVVEVSGDDVLNVRSAPNASAPILDTLEPDATDIEVIRTDDGPSWGLINIGETSGWASLSYLERQPDQWEIELPRIKHCFGTEPFWSLNLASEVPTFSEPEGETTFLIEEEIRSANRTDRAAIRLSGEQEDALLVVSHGYCDDGMSDREYGFSGDLIREESAGTTYLSGCCSLTAN